MRITEQRMVIAALIGLILVAVTATATVTSSGPRKAHVANGTQIGSAVLGTNLRVSLRVYRNGPYDAWVDVATFRNVAGKWQQSWHGRVPGTWLWGPLTGTNGVCSLAVTARPGEVAAIDVSLLITPSVGCSNLAHFSAGQEDPPSAPPIQGRDRDGVV